MYSKQNFKVGVHAAHKSGSTQSFERSNRRALLTQIVSILRAIRLKRRVILSAMHSRNKAIEQFAIAVSFVLFLTVPLLLVCVNSRNFAILWLGTPMLALGIALGVLLFGRRSKKVHLICLGLTRGDLIGQTPDDDLIETSVKRYFLSVISRYLKRQ